LSNFFCLQTEWVSSDQFGAIAILAIHEEVKTVFVRAPILMRAISLLVRTVEVVKRAGRGTKQSWRFIRGQAAKPVIVHNVRLTTRTRLEHFVIALLET